MKKITFLLSFMALSLFTYAQETVLKDFTANTIGDAYPIFGLYQNAVSTSRGTATIAVDPAAINGNAIKVVPISGNHLVQLVVSIPVGTTLANYSSFSFDLYPTNILNDGLTTGQTGARYSTALVQIGSSCTPGAAGATALLFETATVDKGSSNSWHTITVDLTKLTGLSAYSGSQNLFIGLYSNNNTIYYLDNVKIQASTTKLKELNSDERLVVVSDRNSFRLNRTFDKVELYNASGKKLSVSTNSNQISSTNLSKGIYILKATVDGVEKVSKIVK